MAVTFISSCRWNRRGLLFLALGVLSSLVGCQENKPPAPFAAPVAVIESMAFVGTAVSGPTTRPGVAPAKPADAIGVKVTLIALEKTPAVGTPLGSAARLVSASRLGTPVLPTARLTRTARLLELKDAADFNASVVEPTKARSAPLAESRAALVPGLTAALVANDPSPVDPRLAGMAVSRAVAVAVHRPSKVTASGVPQPVDVALIVQDLAPAPQEAGAEELAAPTTGPANKPVVPPPPLPLIVQREIAVVGRLVADRDVVVLTLPFKFGAAPGEAVAAVVELSRGTDDADHQAALARTLQQSKDSAKKAADNDAALNAAAGASATSPSIKAAVSALSKPERLRPTLLYLAGETTAIITSDVTLSADDPTLLLLANAVRQRLEIPGVLQGDSAAVGFQIDLAVFQAMAGLLQAGKLPPELQAITARYAGEVGRNGAKMDEICRTAKRRADFDESILAENWVALDESSPSARVRAYDWLRVRGRAPAGYDPLAPLKERRLALDAAPVGGVAPAPR